MYVPRFTVKELFDYCEMSLQQLSDMNLNGIWPDPSPRCDPLYFDDLETTEAHVANLLQFLEKSWTLSDVKYRGETLLVKFTEAYRHQVKEFCLEAGTEDPAWNNGKVCLLMGEIAQKPGHFVLVDQDTSKFINVTHGFHGDELEIVLPHAEDNGKTVTISPRYRAQDEQQV